MSKKTELAVKQETTIAINGGRGRGFEEETQKEDLIIPRAKLLQALSPEVQAEGSTLKAGMVINSVTQEALPELFVPIFKFTNWIRFNPRDPKSPGFDAAFEPGAIVWRSNDPYDPRVQQQAKFGEDGSKPLATKFLNFFSYFQGVDMPIVLSFCNTSFKAGKQLLSIAQFSGGDMFSNVYRLSTLKESNAMGTYYVLKIAKATASEPDVFKRCEAWWDQFSKKDITVHSEEDTTTDTAERPY